MKVYSTIAIRLSITQCNRKDAIVPLKLHSSYIEITIEWIKVEIIMSERPHPIRKEAIGESHGILKQTVSPVEIFTDTTPTYKHVGDMPPNLVYMHRYFHSSSHRHQL